jgi:hypothetical protein
MKRPVQLQGGTAIMTSKTIATTMEDITPRAQAPAATTETRGAMDGHRASAHQRCPPILTFDPTVESKTSILYLTKIVHTRP